MIRRPPRSTLFPTRRSSDLTPDRPCARRLPAWLEPRGAIPGRPRRLAPFRPSRATAPVPAARSEEHTSELQSHVNLVCRLLLEKKKKQKTETVQITMQQHSH